MKMQVDEGMIEAQPAHFLGIIKRTIYTTYFFSKECNNAPASIAVIVGPF